VPERGSFEALAVAETFGNTIQANLCRMALQESGIEAWLSTEHLAGVHPPLGLAVGVSVLVRPSELAGAKQVLAGLARGEAELPEGSEQCPNCGALRAAAWISRCPACGHQWP
jgi:hypothetical protein